MNKSVLGCTLLAMALVGRGSSAEPAKLKFGEDGTFTIVHLTDQVC